MYPLIKLVQGVLSRLSLLFLLNCCLVAYGQNIGTDANTPSLRSGVYFPLPNQPLFIDTSIENASPVWYESTADATAIYLLYDHERNSSNRAAGHIHIRLETQAGSRVALEFRNLDNIYNGRPGSVAKEMHNLVMSEDGHKWRSVPTIVSEHSVRLEVDVPGQQLYIARVEPYRLSDLEHFLDKARMHPEVNIETIGKTVEGRPLEIMRVGMAGRIETGSMEQCMNSIASGSKS